MLKKTLVWVLLFICFGFLPKEGYRLAVIKYNGGGDYYANPSSLPNLVKFCNQNLGTNIASGSDFVEPGSVDLFNYPLVHLTGHGNVVFSDFEAQNLRKYMCGGGFLHIDDNYGLDKFIRPQIKKIFPEKDLIELPFNHPVYHQKYKFPNGLPKIHEHDNKPPQGFGIIHKGRLVLFYSYECDLGDGWEDAEVHNDAPEKRQEALKMGSNIVQYALNLGDL